MPLSVAAVRKQLALAKPLLTSCSLPTMRKGQNMLGELMHHIHKQEVYTRSHTFERFEGSWILPRDERRQGVILYLHGGGYTCGDLPYAEGFATLLAAKCSTRVFCAAYRLAPEHPFPAALDDALEAYRYLLQKGYAASHITLCGESAGGGLCFALCQRLRECSLPLPCGIIAVSPWTDLTASGTSYVDNCDRDPCITTAMLDFFATQYTTDRTNPLVSPLFAELRGIPPTITFVGENELMKSDAEELHKRLVAVGTDSTLYVKPDRWHAYVVYGLEEDEDNLVRIDRFLDRVMAKADKLRWMRLDNAAKIYPAARRETWSNVFRLSATLTEPIDVDVMQSALDITARRFPSIAVRLRKGLFWYYLQQLSRAPEIREEFSYPLTRMTKEETRHCALRVIVYQNRVAVEIFHSLTDGNGALVFLKSLVAEYLQQRYGVAIPAEHGVLGRFEEPSDEELEDSFLKFAGDIAGDRRERTAWHLRGTPEIGEFLHLTCFQVQTAVALKKAHEYGVSLTSFLCAAVMMALQELQKEQVPQRYRRKPIKVLLPVNLRPLFPSRSLRNFALYTTPEILPRLGEYRFEEICKAVQHRLGLDVNAKTMSMKVATNVNSEKSPIVKVMPLFIKNFVMKAVFDTVGERKSCLTLSNLGNVRVPDAMIPYVTRMDFILGVQATAPYNCGVLSYNGTLYINFIRNIKEPLLEKRFFEILKRLELPVLVESNEGG